MVINPTVRVYIPIIRIPVIKGGRSPIPNTRSWSTLAHLSKGCTIWKWSHLLCSPIGATMSAPKVTVLDKIGPLKIAYGWLKPLVIQGFETNFLGLKLKWWLGKPRPIQHPIEPPNYSPIESETCLQESCPLYVCIQDCGPPPGIQIFRLVDAIGCLIGTSTLPKTSMEPKNDPLGKGKTSTQTTNSLVPAVSFQGCIWYNVIMSIYFFQIYTPIGSMYGN